MNESPSVASMSLRHSSSSDSSTSNKGLEVASFPLGEATLQLLITLGTLVESTFSLAVLTALDLSFPAMCLLTHSDQLWTLTIPHSAMAPCGLTHSFIHSCYTCSRSSFEQRQHIPNTTDHTKQQTDQTNKQRQLPSRVMSNNVLCSTP
jgi:hypothetical protein